MLEDKFFFTHLGKCTHHNNIDSLTKFHQEEPTSNDLPIQNTNKDKSRKTLTWSYKLAHLMKYKK